MQTFSLSPHRYIQDQGLIQKAGEYIHSLGNLFLVIADPVVREVLYDDLTREAKRKKLKLHWENFSGECSFEEIEHLKEIVRKGGFNSVIGTGGGKALDTAKVVAFTTGIPLIAIPTSAATCSAFSSIAAVYTPQGVYRETLELSRNPDITLVDTEVIARAPVRLLSSGMGDTLAKWYEGRVQRGKLKDIDLPTETALRLSRMAQEIITKYGPQARRDAEKKVCSQAVERVIECNLIITGLIGGLGGKKVRSVAAHAINYAMGYLPACRKYLHGERVSFGILVQLVLEKREEKEIEQLLNLYKTLRLPLTLEEVGLSREREKELKELVKLVVRKESRIHRLPFPVTGDMVYKALREVDERGREVKE